MSKRPAYRHIAEETLARAIALGQAAIAGDADLTALNRHSLAWRRTATAISPGNSADG